MSARTGYRITLHRGVTMVIQTHVDLPRLFFDAAGAARKAGSSPGFFWLEDADLLIDLSQVAVVHRSAASSSTDVA